MSEKVLEQPVVKQNHLEERTDRNSYFSKKTRCFPIAITRPQLVERFKNT